MAFQMALADVLAASHTVDRLATDLSYMASDDILTSVTCVTMWACEALMVEALSFVSSQALRVLVGLIAKEAMVRFGGLPFGIAQACAFVVVRRNIRHVVLFAVCGSTRLS